MLNNIVNLVKNNGVVILKVSGAVLTGIGGVAAVLEDKKQKENKKTDK